MEISIDERMAKKAKTLLEDDPINISTIKKEREKAYNTIRKNRIRNEIFYKKKNYFQEEIRNSQFNNNQIIIPKLNINPKLKSDTYINELIKFDSYDKIFEFIKEIYNNQTFNMDILKYGLFCLNEKLLNLEKNISEDFIKKYNFKEMIYLLLMYSKNEINKIDFDDVMLKLTYQIIVNYCYCSYDIDNSFLFDDKYIDLHLYFLDIISDRNIIKYILLMTYNICLDNSKLTNKIFSYNNNRFYNLLTEYINNYHNDNERIEIILDLLICYINIFNKNEHTYKKTEDKIIEMKDNTIGFDWHLIENIYDIVLHLINNKKDSIFTNSILLISAIIKIIYKSKNFELMLKIINNNNTKSMLLFILEKEYNEYPNNITHMSDIIKYIIKSQHNSSSSNELKLNIINLIKNIEQNLNEYDEIIDIFIYYLLSTKLKEKIIIKLIEALSSFIRNEKFYKDIIENQKDDIIEIIIKYINSSNYEIRKKIIKIIEYMTNKRDFILADCLMKNKILNYIKNAIDPNVTYCNDEKLIMGALKVIDNLISIGEIFKKLNGVNSVLIDFENIGGKELLDSLLCNRSELVYNTSLKIIERYFN